MPFVGAAAVLEHEHATVGAASMPATPKKSSVATNCFSRSVHHQPHLPKKCPVATSLSIVVYKSIKVYPH